MKKKPTIEKAVKEGAVVHVFRSGGGLRVLRIEKPRHGKLLGYGEHPNLEEAFRIAEDDIKAGARDYYKVYNGKVEDHYLTGSQKPSSNLDKHVLTGQVIDITHDGKDFVIECSGYSEVKVPDQIVELVQKTKQTIKWISGENVLESRLDDGSVITQGLNNDFEWFREVNHSYRANKLIAAWAAAETGIAVTTQLEFKIVDGDRDESK